MILDHKGPTDDSPSTSVVYGDRAAELMLVATSVGSEAKLKPLRRIYNVMVGVFAGIAVGWFL